jgi:hypothetical protein
MRVATNREPTALDISNRGDLNREYDPKSPSLSENFDRLLRRSFPAGGQPVHISGQRPFAMSLDDRW